MILFFLQLRGELVKLFSRKRTYLGFGAFLSLEIIVLVLCQLPRGKRALRHMIENNGLAFDQYFSGLTLSVIMVSTSIFFLGALFLGLVGGDFVAKEAEEGTLRMTLCRPSSRLRVLAVKYCCNVVYTFSLVFFVGLTALAAAMSMRGTGGLFVLIPEEKLLVLYDFPMGLQRYLGTLPFVALSLLTISTFSFHLSCWNIKPAAAAIAAICVFFADWIIHFMPYFETYKPWLMATHMSTWLNVFRGPIPWQKMVEDYAYLFGLDATFLVIAAVVFQSRDFKS
jgi:ABC-2 type transport system permease protein